MLTKDKITIYKKFNGDIDYWARVGSVKDKALLTDIDWYQIDNLLQDLELLKKGFTSKEFNNKMNERISKIVDSHETLRKMKEILTQ